MTISVVGNSSGGTNTDGGNVTLTLPTLNQGDYVYVAGGFPRNNSNAGPVTNGYSELVRTNNGVQCQFGVWRKVMGLVPDTEVVCSGSGNSIDATAYVVICLRGTIQQPETVATEVGDSPKPDLPPVAVTTSGSFVLVFAGKRSSLTATAAPAGYGNFTSVAGSDSRNFSASVAASSAASGVVNPGEFEYPQQSLEWVANSVVVEAVPEPLPAVHIPTPNLPSLVGSVGQRGGYTAPAQTIRIKPKRRPSPEPKGPSLIDLVRKQRKDAKDEAELVELAILLDALEVL